MLQGTQLHLNLGACASVHTCTCVYLSLSDCTSLGCQENILFLSAGKFQFDSGQHMDIPFLTVFCVAGGPSASFTLLLLLSSELGFRGLFADLGLPPTSTHPESCLQEDPDHGLAAAGVIAPSSCCLLCPVPMVSPDAKPLRPAATGVVNWAHNWQDG